MANLYLTGGLEDVPTVRHALYDHVISRLIFLITPIISVARDVRRRCSAYLARYLEPPVVLFVATFIIVLSLLNLLIACWTSQGGRTIYGSWLGGDYSTFYVAGTILNEYSPSQLYDFNLQNKLLHSLLPGIPGAAELPFLNPPFFALLFKPLSLLPFIPSYLSWILISSGLYVCGFLLIRKTLPALPTHIYTLSLLLAISFEPFIMESAFGGNTSAFGFFALALAIYFERTGNRTLSGISLALCLYKPTLLLLIIPMIIVSRRFRTAGGFIIGAVLLAGISFLTVGKQSCIDYLNILLGVSGKSLSTGVIFRNFKYVDIFSFYRPLFGNFTFLYWGSIMITMIASIPLLVQRWWKLDKLDKNRRDLILACTLTWTTVFNVHFGIYDTVVVVFGILLTAHSLYQSSGKHGTVQSPGFRTLVVLLYITPWISQQMTMFIKIQIYTLVLAATGAYQLYLARCNNSQIECNRTDT